MLSICKYNDLKYYARYMLFRLIPRFLYPQVLKFQYKKIFKCELNLKNPKKLSEKVQWLKLYDNSDLKKRLADKLESKKYVRNLIPEINVAQVYYVAYSFEKLNFTCLPNKFMLKTNHSWKTGILIQDKNKITNKEYKELLRYYKNALGINYSYWAFYEMQYKDIKPKIFAEEYIDIPEDVTNIEYEAYCINGKLEFINLINTFKDEYNETVCASWIYNRNKEIQKYTLNQIPLESDVPVFHYMDEVIKYSDILAKNLKFVRIDFVESNKGLYFLEFTFTPCSGFFNFIPSKYDEILGNILML